MKDSDYIKRMPKEKIENILLYNEQDVVNLFYIFTNWKKYIVINEEEDDILEEAEANDKNSSSDILDDNDKSKNKGLRKKVEEIIPK